MKNLSTMRPTARHGRVDGDARHVPWVHRKMWHTETSQATSLETLETADSETTNGAARRAIGQHLRRDGAAPCSWYPPLKALFDFVAAIVLLIIAAPVILVCAVLVKLTSRGPAFYCQKRVGQDGRVFTLIKLRTMRQDAEARTGPVWCSGDSDPRVTCVGKFLRDTHLDEFPQLINVLLGHMSLVGPRPERPKFVSQFEEEIPHYRARLSVRPGITGLSQMRLPPDSDFDSVRHKLVHDLYYVMHLSPWLDLRILFYTAGELLASIALAAWKLFSLPAKEIVEQELRPMIFGEGHEVRTAPLPNRPR